jgi:hypothetical protein
MLMRGARRAGSRPAARANAARGDQDVKARSFPLLLLLLLLLLMLMPLTTPH